MFSLIILILVAGFVLGLFALWVRAIIFVLKKSGYGSVSWNKASGIFGCLFIISRLFNPIGPELIGDKPVVLLAAVVLGIAFATVFFLVILRLFLGGPLFSKRALKAYLGYIVISIIIGIPTFLAVLGFRAYIASPFQMNGQAMDPTLRHEEYIVVNKWGSVYQRGDIVVFEPPLAQRYYYVERIIGLPGETVVFDGNQVIIFNLDHPGGLVLNEPYLRCVEAGINACSYYGLSQIQYVVPEGAYFVMGDNRMNSTDSRYCFSTCSAPDATPFVPKENIVGKVMGVVWPFEASKITTTPEYLTIPVSSQ